MAWIYFQELVVSDLPSNHGLEQSPIVSVNLTHKAYYCHECNQVKLTLLQSGMMSQHYEEVCCQESTLSSEDSLVRIYQLQELEKVWTESKAVFSSRSQDSQESFDLPSSSLRMSLPSVQGEPIESAKNWPRSGMIVDGLLSQPRQLEPGTNGIGGSCWPTPRASEYKDCGPVGSKSHTHMFNRDYLCAKVKDASKPTGKLNPLWTEWLMGYSIGHTELNASVIQWFRSKSKRHSKN